MSYLAIRRSSLQRDPSSCLAFNSRAVNENVWHMVASSELLSQGQFPPAASLREQGEKRKGRKMKRANWWGDAQREERENKEGKEEKRDVDCYRI